MGKIWLPTGGSGGLDPDELTADASDVLKGKTAGINGNDEPAAGTLELTGTADDSDVLSGKTYYNTDAKQKRTGSIPVNGSMNTSLNCGQSKTIPAGYTTGGTVTANSLASQTSASASAGHILSGQTAWVNGNKITGNMPERGGYGGTGNSQGNDGGNQRFYMNLPNGHYNENARAYIPWSNVRNWAGLTPDKIKKNVSIMGIIGSFQGYTDSPLYLYNNGIWNNLQTTGITQVWDGTTDYAISGTHFYEVPTDKILRIRMSAHGKESFLVKGNGRLNQTVNLSEYKYLKAKVAVRESGCIVYLGVSTNSTLQSFSYIASTLLSNVGVFMIDVSSLKGSYYIYFGLQGTNGFDQYDKKGCSVSELYLTNT